MIKFLSALADLQLPHRIRLMLIAMGTHLQKPADADAAEGQGRLLDGDTLHEDLLLDCAREGHNALATEPCAPTKTRNHRVIIPRNKSESRGCTSGGQGVPTDLGGGVGGASDGRRLRWRGEGA